MKKLRATHQGRLDLLGIKISCAVLENGTRILVDRSVATALGTKGSGAYWGLKKKNDTPMFPEYLSADYLKPFMSEELAKKLETPIQYLNRTGKDSTGVDATLLPKICDVWISAKNAGILTQKQENTANKAYLIMKAFAEVGITALVDEATGYQYDREKDELQKILKKYISEELLPWQKKFPDVFYKELFRLNGWDFTLNGIKKRPDIIGKWTNKLIYEQLPEGVLKELKENIPKSTQGKPSARLHQLLTIDIGNPHLTAQINKTLTLFQLSDNMEHTWQQFKKLQKRQAGQLELPFEFDTNGYTIAPIEKENLSDFNKTLVRALEYSKS